tara:strand:+ start:7789 stop:8928 length:1140 start_codon:yes stop_codon:yes gene_type:complete
MFNEFINFVREIYNTKEIIPLHEPKFIGNEKKYVNQCIDSTFVSSVGKFVDNFEKKIAKYTGAKYAVATTNGTSAIHTSLVLAGVNLGDEVITQSLNFVASCNAIRYCGANPIFLDVDKSTMGLSPISLKYFLENNTTIKNKKCINKKTKKIIKACIPMHSYGHPCQIEEIKKILRKYYIFMIEDAAESLGSYYKNRHTGTYGQLGIISFNGNKIITAGGGGCIITNNKSLAIKAKHITTTAKVPHMWNFNHDEVGYNYRLPNLNAALLLAQLENLDEFILIKRSLAKKYELFFKDSKYLFFKEPKNSKANYWLNSIIFENKKQRNQFLEETNSKGVVTRPIWTLMNKLPMFKDSQSDDLKNSIWLSDRVVNIPSSATI